MDIRTLLQNLFAPARRLYALEGEGPIRELAVEAWLGREALSELSEWRVVAVSANARIVLDAFIGQRVTLVTTLAGGTQARRTGLIRQAEQLGADGSLARYRLTVVPWFWLATQQRHSQVFQNRPLADIFEQVLSPYEPYAAWRFAAGAEDRMAAFGTRRRLRLAGGAQAFESQPFFKRAQYYGAQCANDLSVANALLREEAKDLETRENDPAYSDGWMRRVLVVLPITQGTAMADRLKQTVWGDKVREWREVKAYWNDTSPLDPRIVRICDDYIHDSRAWFKPFGAPSDSVWRMRQQARPEQLKQQDAAWKQVAADLNRDLIGTLKRYGSTANGGEGEVPPNPVVGQDRIDLDRYLKEGSVPMETKGREPSSMWGCLRWRTHFAPTPTLGERAQAAWDEVAAVPGKVARKAKDVAHDAEARLANTARKRPGRRRGIAGARREKCFAALSGQRRCAAALMRIRAAQDVPLRGIGCAVRDAAISFAMSCLT